MQDFKLIVYEHSSRTRPLDGAVGGKLNYAQYTFRRDFFWNIQK